MTAAIPKYMPADSLDQTSPGMRFGMFLDCWNSSWEKVKTTKLDKVTPLKEADRARLANIRQRQMALASQWPTETARFFGRSTAPFTTGLGNEHPLENGFAFLWPYGLPYLPGSGVKGVIRQAARELVSGQWGDHHGWNSESIVQIKTGGTRLNLTAMDLLLGLESANRQKEHFRGVLSFWDVIPAIKGDELMIEIMTPHQKHYYQDCKPPHDSGQPIPIQFLTLPPGSEFTFHVVCDLPRLQRLAPQLAENNQWQKLLSEAFEHAFDWLGFGAKTATGYGAMEVDIDSSRSPTEQKAVQWIEENVKNLMQKSFLTKNVALISKGLAEKWSLVEDETLKKEILKQLELQWAENNRGPSKKARGIYNQQA